MRLSTWSGRSFSRGRCRRRPGGLALRRILRRGLCCGPGYRHASATPGAWRRALRACSKRSKNVHGRSSRGAARPQTIVVHFDQPLARVLVGQLPHGRQRKRALDQVGHAQVTADPLPAMTPPDDQLPAIIEPTPRDPGHVFLDARSADCGPNACADRGRGNRFDRSKDRSIIAGIRVPRAIVACD
jgi:hypothetical protein